MEMIEDIPAIGPVSATVRLPSRPTRAYEAVSGRDLDLQDLGDGTYGVTPGSAAHPRGHRVRVGLVARHLEDRLWQA
ncbi:hypothetical protein N8D56_20325 [Devosia sp. A8/3-2]|nr:hypothetical protein N8D56_20325 [Devosia sp. A8/3-2]